MYGTSEMWLKRIRASIVITGVFVVALSLFSIFGPNIAKTLYSFLILPLLFVLLGLTVANFITTSASKGRLLAP